MGSPLFRIPLFLSLLALLPLTGTTSRPIPGEPTETQASVPAASPATVPAPRGWLGHALSGIDADEARPRLGGGGIEFTSRSGGLRASFHRGGLDLVHRTHASGAPWRWRTVALRRGHGGNASRAARAIGAAFGATQFADCAPAILGPRVVYDRGPMIEWYENTVEGIEQGFDIPRRPAGWGPLRIEGRVDPGDAEVRLAQLRAWDARGRHLPILRESRADGVAELVAYVVDDRDAQYPVTVDPILTTPSWHDDSDQASASYGAAVACAGDVNNDGYDDIVIGAPLFDGGQVDEGRVYLYLGSPDGPSVSPDWTYEPNVAGQRAGSSVAGVGDVNNDGFDDVAVGLPRANAPTISAAGAAVLFLGQGSGLAATPAWTRYGDSPNSHFGGCVAWAGDVDRDGYEDVLVGAPGYQNGNPAEGRAYLFRGSAGGPFTAPGWTFEANQDSSGLGDAFTLSGAGDVNGDGYADVVVGVPRYDNGQVDEGRIYLFTGGSPTSLTQNTTREVNQAGARFGAAVSLAGDMNGNGYGEIIVGAPYYDNGQTDEGHAYVYAGSSTGLGAGTLATYQSNESDARLGASVATAGDVNSDGFAEVLVGSPGADGEFQSEGRASIYPGSQVSLTNLALWTTTGGQQASGFGAAVACAGDVNGDGLADVIVGAPNRDLGQTNEGQAQLFLGAPQWPGTESVLQNDSGFGADNYSAVAWVGDINGDGMSDLVAGAPTYDNGTAADAGRVVLLLGREGALPSSILDDSVSTPGAGARLGTSVSGTGDFDGDGYEDVIGGAPFDGTGGRVHLFRGSASSGLIDPDVTSALNQASAEYGRIVAGVGDVNGDGFGDFVAAAPRYDNGQTDEGAAFLVLGHAGLGAMTPQLVCESNAASGGINMTVAGVGDVNRDGYSDVVVGFPSAERTETNEGLVFLLLGSPTPGAPLQLSSWRYEPNVSSEGAGFAVAGAGDVNGDGYSDILIASRMPSTPFTTKNHVFLGGPNGPSTLPSWTLTDANLVGFVIGPAGDVNGDGYSDILLGNSSAGASSEGRIVLLTGGPSGPGFVSPWSVTGPAPGAVRGRALSNRPGDFGGDGWPDILGSMAGSANDAVEILSGNAVQKQSGSRVAVYMRREPPSPQRVPHLGILPTFEAGQAVRRRSPYGRASVTYRATWVGQGDGSAVVQEANVPDTGAPGPSGSLNNVVLAFDELLPSRQPVRFHAEYTSRTCIFFRRSHRYTLPDNGLHEADYRTGANPVAVDPPAVGDGGAIGIAVARVGDRWRFTLRGNGAHPARLDLYDVRGRRVARLARGEVVPGEATVEWDGRSDAGARVAPGVYFVRLALGATQVSRRVVIGH